MQLLHGDCLELMKDIPDNSVDLVLTDPPYGRYEYCQCGKTVTKTPRPTLGGVGRVISIQASQCTPYPPGASAGVI